MTVLRFRHMSWVASFLATYRSRPRLPYSATRAARPSILDLSGLRYFADDPGDSFRRFRAPVAINGEISYLALSEPVRLSAYPMPVHGPHSRSYPA